MTKAIMLIIWLVALLAPVKSLADTVQVISEDIKYSITTSKVAHVYGSIDRNSSATFEAEMLTTTGKPGDRIVLINSPGGEVREGAKMIKMIEVEKTMHTRVVCVVLHDASSMAFNLLTHCDIRLASARAHATVHKVAYQPMVTCENGRCTARLLRQKAAELDKDDEPYRIANAKAMHLSLEDYDLFADQDHIWAAPVLYAKGYLAGYAAAQNLP